jgi:hypothetical protein
MALHLCRHMSVSHLQTLISIAADSHVRYAHCTRLAPLNLGNPWRYAHRVNLGNPEPLHKSTMGLWPHFKSASSDVCPACVVWRVWLVSLDLTRTERRARNSHKLYASGPSFTQTVRQIVRQTARQPHRETGVRHLASVLSYALVSC